jgi:Tfp pilus assembly protein PilN
MSLVNLLPPEIRQRQQTRKVAFLIAAGGVALLLLIFFVYLLETQSLSGVNADVDDQTALNANLQVQIADLQRFADLQNEAAAKQALLSLVFADELSFSGALRDVSRVIPSDAYLTSLTITVTPTTTAVEPTGVSTGIIGTIAFSGTGATPDSVAALLTRLENVRGWVNPFVSTVTHPESGNIVEFAGTVDLTVDALTQRGRSAIAGGVA